jgi:hypothetical protein
VLTAITDVSSMAVVLEHVEQKNVVAPCEGELVQPVVVAPPVLVPQTKEVRHRLEKYRFHFTVRVHQYPYTQQLV